ncbi:ubiquinol-cytochrome C chaperone family protein [Parvularcula lutaonensis]|uniref:Ubiquinol-cytochrome C chaperone family protein n=1 Tax=Parvularcula lutaonensis TaxID=491923 RepID=A0ABV7MDV0_9PROT|nr:ubiquinol-cytochrome C chaperone family protein [Parvularcula lutaonensis]GGY49058.1 ubiquinol-cytochrome c chaperone [Parvularcula lutaonensis]
MFERAKELASRFFGQDTPRRRAHELYVAVAEAARRPEFYADLDVPDTPEGRYDLLSLHVIMVLRRLKTEKQGTAKFAQLLFDVMFRDVDDTLREMGVGDLKVGKKVREYAEAFFGRALAYEKALDGEEPLETALGRNVYGDPEAPAAPRLADYVRRADAALDAQPISDIMSGQVHFPPVQNTEE